MPADRGAPSWVPLPDEGRGLPDDSRGPPAGGEDRAWRPAYLDLPRGEMGARARRAVAMLEECRACPRDCGVNRLADRWAACTTGRHAITSGSFPHHGEEDCLRGWNGSGAIFFVHCNLRCVFCQNFDISQAVPPGRAVPGTPPAILSRMMLDLQDRGCHNINLVTPEHVVPQIVEALETAIGQGLALPIVYNTSAYDSLESLRLLDGIVDIYMPDFKLWTEAASRRYLKAADYPCAARAAIREMHRQVGPLVLDGHGLARRGVLLRHLVMPGLLEETRAILSWTAATLGGDTWLNLMDQYHPAGLVSEDCHPEIGRGLTSAEYESAVRMARDLGLVRLDAARVFGS